ncbi:iron-sulfur flavoprotein [Candidatus Vecturithrix granuli]|uniref:Iron-sulfur flavoprotein n=1 Tax=Vecturithrix granuli TaxID=1499967 RepID=A0A081BUZ0_VECG1|nr:iron-sulfur flavoprotein [Candidatus Vecturithrix granuli]
MKKVLGILGSPRKHGNTHLLIAKVLEGAREKGAQAELVTLDALQIHECNGCHACWREKECSKQDDMNTLYPKIAESDVLIFGTPVYWYAPTALMKAFIDRFVYFNCPANRGKIQGKSAVLVIPFEEDDPEMVAPLLTFFDKCFQYLQVQCVAKLIAPGVTKKGEVRDRPEYLAEAFQIGQSLV